MPVLSEDETTLTVAGPNGQPVRVAKGALSPDMLAVLRDGPAPARPMGLDTFANARAAMTPPAPPATPEEAQARGAAAAASAPIMRPSPGVHEAPGTPPSWLRLAQRSGEAAAAVDPTNDPANYVTTPRPAPGPSAGPMGIAQQMVTGQAGMEGQPLLPAGPRAPSLKVDTSGFEAERKANEQLAATGAAKAAEMVGFQDELARQAAVRESRLQEQQKLQTEFFDKEVGEFQRLSKELQKPEAQVDPSRFWASRNTGQKILGAIGLALGGFAQGLTGGRNPALDILQKAMDDDMGAQRDNLANARAQKRDALTGQQTLLGMARQRFSDEATAEAAAYAAGLGKVQAQITSMASRYGNKETMANADLLNAQLEQKRGEYELRAKQLISDNALKWANHSLQRAELGIQTAAAKGKEAGATKIPASEAAALGSLETAERALMALDKSWDTKTGAVSGVAQHLPGTKSAQYNDQKLAAAQVIGTILEGGKLTDSDLSDKYLPLMPSAGDGESRKTAKVENLRRMLRDFGAGKREGLGRAGYDVSRFTDHDAEAKADAERKQSTYSSLKPL